jgi:hypothetical protein
MDSNRKKRQRFCTQNQQTRKTKKKQAGREMRQNHTKSWSKGPEQLAGTAIQAKEQSCSYFSSFLRLPVSCFLILSIQGGNRENQPSKRRTQEPIATRDRCRDGGGKGTQIRERERDRWNGWRKNCQEGEGDREEGGGGDERMDVREEVGVGEKYG